MKNSITQPVCDLMNHSCQQPLITTIRLASCLPGSSSTTSTSSDHLNFYLRTDQGKRCQLAADICDLLIVVAFGHNELWRPKVARRVSVTFQMLLLSATMNCGGRRPQNLLLSWLKYRQMATPLTTVVRRTGAAATGGIVACISYIIVTPSQNPPPSHQNLNIKIIIDYYRVKKLLPGNAKA